MAKYWFIVQHATTMLSKTIDIPHNHYGIFHTFYKTMLFFMDKKKSHQFLTMLSQWQFKIITITLLPNDLNKKKDQLPIDY
jgi:hypothetical protein